jgi:preprotein translocase subunit YajC
LNKYAWKEVRSWLGIAYALGQGGAGGEGAAGFTGFIPLILMFVIFYFLLIRPQQKKSKEHRQMVSNLKKGDRIITSGGIHGRITGMDDTTLTVEIADKVRVKVARGNVSAMVQSAPSAGTGEKVISAGLKT